MIWICLAPLVVLFLFFGWPLTVPNRVHIDQSANRVSHKTSSGSREILMKGFNSLFVSSTLGWHFYCIFPPFQAFLWNIKSLPVFLLHGNHVHLYGGKQSNRITGFVLTTHGFNLTKSLLYFHSFWFFMIWWCTWFYLLST